MKIAVIISGFPIQGYLRDLIDCFTTRGHEVTLFKTVHRESLDTVDFTSLSISVQTVEARDRLFRWLRAGDKKLATLIPIIPSMSMALLSLRFERYIQKSAYDLIIGVEKMGLIIAAALEKKRHIPYIYYSLELYVEDHPSIAQYKYLRRPERSANAGALLTIIQDERRTKVLATANNLREHRFIYLPVGVIGPVVRDERKRSGMSLGRVMILYVGLLTKHRRIEELIQITDELGEDEYLYLQGPNFTSAIEYNSQKKLIVSKATLPEEELLALVAASDIGIALYFNEPANDRLTAFSSHKIALYLKYGKPIIVPKNESYEDLMNLYPCGEMIDNISEIPAAVKKIIRHYDSYSRQAFLAFDHFYNLSLNAPRIIDAIEQLMRLD